MYRAAQELHFYYSLVYFCCTFLLQNKKKYINVNWPLWFFTSCVLTPNLTCISFYSDVYWYSTDSWYLLISLWWYMDMQAPVASNGSRDFMTTMGRKPKNVFWQDLKNHKNMIMDIPGVIVVMVGGGVGRSNTSSGVMHVGLEEISRPCS